MISHSAATPLYLQLQEQLEKAISEGVYKPGDKLPSENEMCKQYNVSRITVRQTISMLMQKDLVYSVHGKGTFVKVPAINHELSKIVRFGTSLRQKGLNGFTRVDSFYPMAENKKASEVLLGKYCNLNLVGYAQDTPVVYYQSFVKDDLKEKMYRYAKGFEMQHVAFSSYDLYDKMGIRIRRVEQIISAINSDESLNLIFEASGNNALIVLETTYYSNDDTPLEYKKAYYRSDIYSFYLQRSLD
ncbi:MAG: GntR family transcriptional regulator [Angelakisella sp.]|nr:GntR family transcriptional regulator [Angelakisella sp.]